MPRLKIFLYTVMVWRPYSSFIFYFGAIFTVLFVEVWLRAGLALIMSKSKTGYTIGSEEVD